MFLVIKKIFISNEKFLFLEKEMTIPIPKPNSRWSSIRDKNNLNKIRLQRFNEEIKNADNFLKKNEMIFDKYQSSKGTNFLNLFNSAPKPRLSKNILLPFTKNVIAQRFTQVLKKQFLTHAINEKQIKFLNDLSYSKMTEFAKRRQNIQKKLNEFVSQNKMSSIVIIKASFLIILRIECCKIQIHSLF